MYRLNLPVTEKATNLIVPLKLAKPIPRENIKILFDANICLYDKTYRIKEAESYATSTQDLFMLHLELIDFEENRKARERHDAI